MKNLTNEELKSINGGSEVGYKLGYYFTKGMTKVMDAAEDFGQWVNGVLGID